VFCQNAGTVAANLQKQGVFVVPGPDLLRIALCAVSARDIPVLVDELVKQIGPS
jgi:hypothetical protein